MLLMLVADGLLVAVQVLMSPGVLVNIKWKAARFACPPRTGSRTTLRLSIGNTLHVKEKINEEPVSHGDSTRC